ncbi:MAG TPA: PAS domain S-box protein, partial [Trueperaceae bacterium]|nr:PAS domain S-box protein [Trueperaceae bacterium]
MTKSGGAGKQRSRKMRVPVTFTTDLSGRITSWSEGARLTLGYDPSDLLGQPLATLFSVHDAEHTIPLRLLEIALAKGSASLAGWRVTKNGEKVFMVGDMTTLYGADLEAVGFSVVLSPAPAPAGKSPAAAAMPSKRRKPAEPDLPDPAILAATFSRSDERFYVLDEDLDFVFLNDQASREWGVDPDGILGKNFVAAFPQLLDTEFLAAHLKAATEGVSLRLETLSPLTGRRVEASIFPNRNGGVTALVRDPFERTAQNARLVDDERMAEAYAALEIAVIQWHPESGEWTASGGCTTIFGLVPTDVLRSRDHQLELLHPTDLDAYKSVVEHAVEHGEDWRHEYRVVRPVDGQIAWLEEVATASLDVSGSPSYTLTVWDVTARKLTDEEMRSSQRLLQRELAANRRLQEILTQAGRAEEPQEALTYVVEAACDLFAAKRGCIRLLVPQDAKLSIVAQRGYGSAYLDANATLPVDAVLFDSAFYMDVAGNYRIVPSAAPSVGSDVKEGDAYCERWVPLVGLNGRVVGLLTLEWVRPYGFSERDELDLAVLA